MSLIVSQHYVALLKVAADIPHTTLYLAMHFIDPVHNLMRQITDNDNNRDRRTHGNGNASLNARYPVNSSRTFCNK